MRAPTLEFVSDMDIRVFSKEELLSLRDEIDKELETREKKKESRTPLDLFAQQARRDVCCPQYAAVIVTIMMEYMRQWSKS